MMILRLAIAIVAASGLALAQDQTPADNPPQNSAPPTDTGNIGPKSPQWKGLTVGEKLRYDWIHLFDVENMVFAAMGAGIDQARNRPSEWGEGWGPYGERFASHIGYYVIQRSIMFPVQAIDHEDTRYFRSTRTSYQGRVGDALLHTVWRHNDSGGMMPAYSEFLGDYGAAAISRLWWPSNYHKASSILIAGSDTVLVDAGINVFNEFKPDLKRWLHLNH
ncbi:MAG TPA: hypothetical protein VK789_27955 [Bryobacteraceae bacterium]|jgi:hypothetical protein|nr:hypothetical protein [Bryobacteraceae bacterium]